MGAAHDIKKGLTKNLANFTKQRKAEDLPRCVSHMAARRNARDDEGAREYARR